MAKEQVVIDSSTLLSYILPDEKTPKEIEKIMEKFSKAEIDLVAPPLLKIEIANALRSVHLSGRATEKEAKTYLKTFLELNIKYKEPNLEKVLHNSVEKGLSVYDGVFFTLAKEEKVRLISLDKHLATLV